jgi:hypothetical protein
MATCAVLVGHDVQAVHEELRRIRRRRSAEAAPAPSRRRPPGRPVPRTGRAVRQPVAQTTAPSSSAAVARSRRPASDRRGRASQAARGEAGRQRVVDEKARGLGGAQPPAASAGTTRQRRPCPRPRLRRPRAPGQRDGRRVGKGLQPPEPGVAGGKARGRLYPAPEGLGHQEAVELELLLRVPGVRRVRGERAHHAARGARARSGGVDDAHARAAPHRLPGDRTGRRSRPAHRQIDRCQCPRPSPYLAPQLLGHRDVAGQQAELEWRDGVPVSTRFADPYYSLENGLAETRYVFLAGNDLPDRFRPGFHVAELGIGTGLNLLAASALWRESGPRPPSATRASRPSRCAPTTCGGRSRPFPSVAEDCAGLAAALGAWRAVRTGRDRGPSLLRRCAGRPCPAGRGRPTPGSSTASRPPEEPELWEPALLAEVARHTAPPRHGGDLFRRGRAVRRSLAAAGFAVERRPGYGRKRHMTVARLP